MTVDTLIEKLQKFKEDGAGKAEVRMHDRNGEAAGSFWHLIRSDPPTYGSSSDRRARGYQALTGCGQWNGIQNGS